MSFSRWDYIEVRDGDNESAPLIGNRLSGNTLPSTIVSSGNVLYIKFHSDAGTNRKGYRIKTALGKIQFYINVYHYQPNDKSEEVISNGYDLTYYEFLTSDK